MLNTDNVNLIAYGMNEMSAKYSKFVDEKVCSFLESQGYRVEKTKFGMKRLKQQLQNEGKRVELKTINQTLKSKSNGTLEFSFKLQIELKEVKK